MFTWLILGGVVMMLSLPSMGADDIVAECTVRKS